MRLLDRFLNPTWHRINSLGPQAKYEVALIVCVTRFLRKAIEDELVEPLEKLCLTAKEPALLKAGQRAAPFQAQIRSKLLDEGQIAWLTCMRGKPLLDGKLKLLKSDEAVDGIGCIVLADVNSRTGRAKPQTLADSPYSQDWDESKVQLALAWVKVLGLADSDAAAALSRLLDAQWRSFRELSAGMSIGVSSMPADMVLKRASAECQDLSASARTMIDYLAAGLEKKEAAALLRRVPTNHGPTERPNPPSKVAIPETVERTRTIHVRPGQLSDEELAKIHALHRENADILYEEVLARTKALTKQIDDETGLSRHGLVMTIKGSVEKGREFERMMSLHRRTYTLGLVLGLVGMRRARGREVYVTGIEFRRLQDHVAQEMSRLVEQTMSKLEEEAADLSVDSVGRKRRSADIQTEDLRAIRRAIVEYCYQLQKGVRDHTGPLLAWYKDRTGISEQIAPYLPGFVTETLASGVWS